MKEGRNERESNANANRTRNPKPDFSAEIILRYLFLDFHLYRSIGKSEKGFEKLSLRTAVLHAHASLTKRTPLFTRTVLQILFRISQSNGKEIQEIRHWNPTRFRISCSIAKSEIRISILDLNPHFPIERNLSHLIINCVAHLWGQL